MNLSITVNTQSSIRIADKELVIRFDPYKITGEPQDADLIFFTHDHYDHFSPEDIQKVCKPDSMLTAPKKMQAQVKKLGNKNITLLAPGETSSVRGINVETVASYNFLKPFHPKSNGNLGYIITLDSQRIYVAGDTDAVREAKAVRCDIAFVPIGGTFTMNAKEAAALINTIQPKIAVPTHYGSIVGKMSDGEVFRKLVKEPIETRLLLVE